MQSVDIVNGQVGSVDIGQGQVTSGDIQDNGITSADLGNVVTIVQGDAVSFAPGENVLSQPVDCPSGKIITGGGFFVSGDSDATQRFRVLKSHPVDANTWQVGGFNEHTTKFVLLTTYALCA